MGLYLVGEEEVNLSMKQEKTFFDTKETTTRPFALQHIQTTDDCTLAEFRYTILSDQRSETNMKKWARLKTKISTQSWKDFLFFIFRLEENRKQKFLTVMRAS